VKYLYLIFLSFFLISCSNGSKEVYWCGDHACINKKERKIYFAETMIVEVRKLDKEFKAIKLKDKKYTKKIKKNDDDSYIKAGELSIKKTKKSKKQKIKKPTKKKSKKWFFKKEVIDKSTYGESALSKFNDLAKKISKRNELRDYPDINNIEIKNND